MTKQECKTSSTDSYQLSFDNELYEEAEIKPSYWVNQSPSLINMPQNLTLNERRIIYALIALVQPDDKNFKVYEIRVKDLAKLIGVQANSFYTRVEKAVDGLQSKVLEVRSPDGKIRDKINWVQRSTYNDGEGTVRIQLGDGLAEYLLNLDNYRKYRFINVIRLKSIYSWRIYELLIDKEWQTNPISYKGITYKTYRIIKVKDLRKLLQIPDDKYKLIKHLRTAVLDKAKKELEEVTDICFEYDVYKKKGRNIDSFIFYIRNNPAFKNTEFDVDSVQTDIQQILNLLVRYGVRQKKAIELIEKYNYHYLDANIRYVLNNSLNEVSNIAGYIIKAIEENFAKVEITPSDEQTEGMYNLILGKLETKLSEVYKKNIKDFQKIIRHFNMQASLCKTTEEINQISISRGLALNKKWRDIQQERKEMGLPPLSIDEIDDEYVKKLLDDILIENE